MPYLQLAEKKFPLRPGDTFVGSGPDVHIALEGTVPRGVLATLHVAGSEAAVIRPASGAPAIRINGIALGAEPTPLIHGDKIIIGGRELLYGDDRKAGSTQHLATVHAVEETRPPVSVGGGIPSKPVASSAGRLVSLVDGREYDVPADGLVLGRDPSCDVVIPAAEVSRKHAVITLSPRGYVVTDASSNGVQVNGDLVATSRPLARGDVIRIANEEFRFYGDAVQETPTAPVLATLEVVNESLKGQHYDIRAPLTHVGRGAHNDIVVSDTSVSDSHVKIQRRAAGWFLVDMGSTNGTYVGGRRVDGEQKISRDSDLRLGNIKMVFRPAAREADVGGDADEGGSQTRVIAPFKPMPSLRPTAPTPVSTGIAPPASRARPRSDMAKGGPASRQPKQRSLPWVWIALVLALGVFLLLQSR